MDPPSARSRGTPGPERERLVPPRRGTTVWRPPEPALLEEVTATPECWLSGVPVPPLLPRQASATGRRGLARDNGSGAQEQRFPPPRVRGAARGRRSREAPRDAAPGSRAGAGD